MKTSSNLRLSSNWNELIGQNVEVWLAGQQIADGIVDTAAPDSSVLWLASRANTNRKLYDRATGYEVWVDSGESMS
ncbi:hypothetical protein [Paenarthrobacter sp. YJN-5]|uniref:hypothetical protein n=1 Tax=Paenarthrobacter sp. YJN-5 TaxID=2735316 RepID=UPI001878599A|nr:hypothetical protein [Paenarthrobacter sp. YJN-5]QOT19822.1 hypothetical protein HMI59_24540 [Paenarthrobacter sp. YJN-5]